MRKLKCVICKKPRPPEEVTKTPASLRYACKPHINPECLTQLSLQLLEKSREEKHKKRKKQVVENDLRHQLKLTQRSFNRMRVLEEKKWFSDRGLEPACISCGKPKGGDQWCCGHNKTVGANGSLRFDKRNTMLQHNFNCNMSLSGDIAGTNKTHGYRKGVLIRFGEIEGQKILDFCDTHGKPKKWNCQELITMRAEFNAEIKRLESINP